jgi:predicted MFS family arabinose efflux permease
MRLLMTNSRFIAWTVWIVASIFYAYQYILRVMPNIMLNDIMQQFNIDAAIFGQFSGVYYMGYSLMHIPIGIFLDRYGPRKVMSICILLTVIGLLPIVYSEQWIYPLIGRILIGIGSSAAILGTFKIIRITFKEKHFSRMLSFTVMIGLMGAIYGGAPVSYLCDQFGYQVVVQIFGVMGLGLAAMTFFIVPEMESPHETSVMADIKEVLSNSKVIWICICSGLMVGPLEGFADVWGGEFFKQVYGYDAGTATKLPSVIFLGMGFGAPVLNYIAEKTQQYFWTIIGSGITMALIFFTLLSGGLSQSLIAASFFIVGVCSSYQVLAIYKASTYVRDHVAGLTTAVANMIIMSFGYAFHTIIGLVVNYSGDLGLSKAYEYGIVTIPIALTMAAIGFLSIQIQEYSLKGKVVEA